MQHPPHIRPGHPGDRPHDQPHAPQILHLYQLLTRLSTLDDEGVLLTELGIVDMTLTASLVVIVFLSGYTNFVAPVLMRAGDGRPHWIAEIDFGELKLKLMASIVAISAIKLLEGFMDIAHLSDRELGIHLAFVLSACLLALADAAVWTFQPLGTGTAIFVACVITGLVVRLTPGEFFGCIGRTLRQVWLAVVTVMLIIGLAYLMNYSGLAYTLGKGAASTRHLFILLSPFLGWVAVMLSGSDTSGNALFGNLQVVAAKQLDLTPILFAATNSSGGVMGKMISPQNIATGVSVTNLRGQEGVVFARTFWHSIILTLLLSALVIVQQFVIPWVIPTVGG